MCDTVTMLYAHGPFRSYTMTPLYLLAAGDTFRHGGVTWVIDHSTGYHKHCRPFGSGEALTAIHYDTVVMVDEF